MPEPDPGSALRGIPASPGRASGPLFVVEEEPQPSDADLATASPQSVAAVAERVAMQLERLANDRRDRAPDAAAILEAQALMARDPALKTAIDESLAAGRGPGPAITEATEGYATLLEQADDP